MKKLSKHRRKLATVHEDDMRAFARECEDIGIEKGRLEAHAELRPQLGAARGMVRGLSVALVVTNVITAICGVMLW